MNLAATLQYLYPDAATDSYLVEADSATGEQRITYWNEGALGPTPTDAELNASWIPALKEMRKKELTRNALESLDGLFIEGYENRHMLLLLARYAQTGELDSRLQDVVSTGGALFAARDAVDAVADDDPDAEQRIRTIT